MNWTYEQYREAKDRLTRPLRRVDESTAVRVFDDSVDAGREIEELHYPFMRWLKLHRFQFIRATSAGPSGIQPGVPDFTIFGPGRTVCMIEFKTRKGRLSQVQADYIADLNHKAHWVLVTTSMREACDFVRAKLGEAEG